MSDSPRLQVATADIEFAVRRFQNTIEDIYNLMSLMNFDTWKGFIYETGIGKYAQEQSGSWIDRLFNGSFDDAGVGPYSNACDRRECNRVRL